MEVIEKKKIENIHEEQPPTLHKEEKLKYQLSFIDDLYATTPYMEPRGHIENVDVVQNQVVRENFANELGYDVVNANKFVGKLISEHLNIGNYFIRL